MFQEQLDPPPSFLEWRFAWGQPGHPPGPRLGLPRPGEQMYVWRFINDLSGTSSQESQSLLPCPSPTGRASPLHPLRPTLPYPPRPHFGRLCLPRRFRDSHTRTHTHSRLCRFLLEYIHVTDPGRKSHVRLWGLQTGPRHPCERPPWPPSSPPPAHLVCPGLSSEH